MNITLSATKLNLLRECPRCFWLAMVKNLKRPPGFRSSVPIKMDSIIKQYYDSYRAQNELPPILGSQIHGQLAVNMPATLQWHVDKQIILCGRPDDYIQFQSGTTVPLDHKTRSKLPDAIHPAYQLQLGVYSYLLEMNGYKTVNKGLLAYYCPHSGDLHKGMPLQCTVKEITTDPKHVLSMIRQARNILTGPVPKPAEHCNFCAWLRLMTKNKYLPEEQT